MAYDYEPFNVIFIPPPKKRRYKPDFVPKKNQGLLIEAKGYFTSEDRTKHLDIKASRPDVEVRFVFQKADRKLSKSSPTTYAMWCDKHGFMWAEGRVPKSWVS